MVPDIRKYEKFLNEKLAERRFLVGRIDGLKSKSESLLSRLDDLDEAITVFNVVGIIANDEAKEVVEGIVTEALQLVYDETYSFVVDNKVQRGQPETHFGVKIRENTYSLRDEELGGGVIDVVSFTLRVTSWAINDPRTDDVLVLDEPLKNVDSERLHNMGLMIKRLSQELDLQFIIVTHEPELMENADSTWYVKQRNGLSSVEIV